VFRNFRRRFAGVLRCLVTDRGTGSGVQDSASGPAADFDIIFSFVFNNSNKSWRIKTRLFFCSSCSFRPKIKDF
jgi:hypothetical protein